MNNISKLNYFLLIFLTALAVFIKIPFNESLKITSTNEFASTAENEDYLFNAEKQLSQIDQDNLDTEYDQMAADFENSTEFNDNELSSKAFENFENSIKNTDENIKNLTNKIIQPDTRLIETTAVNNCSDESLLFENKFVNYKKIISLAASDYLPKPKSVTKFNKLCVAYAMNSFNLPSDYRATCTSLSSLPRAGADKPCVTDNLVNLTYNSYMDAMECLDLNPKHIFPKLFNESGFLINTLGGGFDAGVAQMTKSGISGANDKYDFYIKEIKKKAALQPNSACGRLNKNINLISKASELKIHRCTLIALPDNPLKGFVYAAMLNQANRSNAKNLFTEHNLEKRIINLGYKNVDIEALINIIGTLGYNSGLSTSFSAIKTYVEYRENHNLGLSENDFDFSIDKTAIDIDGESKSVLAIARNNVRSPFTTKGDLAMLKIRRLNLPQKINNSYKLSFPEHLIYQQNSNFVLGSKKLPKNFKLSGAPGYISFLKSKDTEIRLFLSSINNNPDICSDENFLKTSK